MVGQDWSLPVAFYFQVEIGGEEYAFKEVSGLDAEMDVESVREGGTNDFEYKLPKQVRHGNLVLKRALIPVDSALVSWAKGILEGDLFLPVTPMDIQVNLLGSEGTPVYSWACSRAYPVRWSVDVLDAEKNSVLIETLEFVYQTLKRS